MSVWDALALTVVIAWRYLSGHTISGVPSTNATWFKRGTMPKHRVNWWSGKPRIHRAMYRIASIGIPIGWVYLYSHFRFWTIAVTIGIAATIIRHIWETIVKHSTRQVHVSGNYETPTEIHEINPESNEKDLGEWPPKEAPKRKGA